MEANSKSWQSIIEFYGQFKASPNWNPEALRDLAIKIRNSEYAIGLYPVTSMHVLYIGQTPEFDINRGALKIEFKDKEIHFELMSSYKPSKNWKRTVDPDKAYDALVKFLESEKWFVKYHQNA